MSSLVSPMNGPCDTMASPCGWPAYMTTRAPSSPAASLEDAALSDRRQHDLDERIATKTDANRGARRKVLGEDRTIPRVHALELRHDGHVDQPVDKVRPVEAGGFERPLDARERFDRLRHGVAPVGWCAAQHTGDVETIAYLNGRTEIRVGATRCAVGIRCNNGLPRRILDRGHRHLDEALRTREPGSHGGACRRRDAVEVRAVDVVHRLVRFRCKPYA